MSLDTVQKFFFWSCKHGNVAQAFSQEVTRVYYQDIWVNNFMGLFRNDLRWLKPCVGSLCFCRMCGSNGGPNDICEPWMQMRDLALHPRHKRYSPSRHQREREGECLLTTLYKLMHQRSNIIYPENPLTMANQSWKRRRPSAPLCQCWPTYTHSKVTLENSTFTTQQMYTWTFTSNKWKLVFTHKPMHMFTAALFMMAPDWNKPKCPSTSE